MTWLWRLRGLSGALQALAALWAVLVSDSLLAPLVLLFGSLATAATNAWASRATAGHVEPATVVSSLVALDIAVLWLELAVTAGHSNPFCILFLVQVTVAAVLTSPRSTWALTAFSSVAYAALFFWHEDFEPFDTFGTILLAGGGHQHEAPYASQLRERWLAFTVVAALIAWFVSRLAQALAEERLRRDRSDRLASITTLAASAAHELRNPLATIKIAADELLGELATARAPASLRDDAALVVVEVGRVCAVLDRLERAGGHLRGESVATVALGALARGVEEALSPVELARVTVAVEPAEVTLPVSTCVQTLAQLVRNGLETGPSTQVRLALSVEGTTVVFAIEDDGPGMSRAALSRLGEPFFTTKPADSGTGLGVYLAAAFVEQLHGTFEVWSRVGQGTLVHLRLPAAPARGEWS